MGSLQDALVRTGLADETQTRGSRKESGAGKPNKNKAVGGKKPRAARPAKADGRPAPHKAAGNKPGKPRSDLEKAWLARRRAEKEEKERQKQARVADQEARRKRNLELDRIVEGRILNDETAEIPRYFEHIGRIRRVLCTGKQREAINAGELGVVNLRGRYLIVAPDVIEEYAGLAPDLVPDLGGSEPEVDDDYPPVPDDLTW